MTNPTIELDVTDIRTLKQLRPHQPVIIYDGDCFLCSNFVTLFRASDSIGAISLANGRAFDPTFKEALHRTYNLDKGMLFIHLDVIHHGADAANVMAALSSKNGLINKVSAMLFSSAHLSKILYPIMRFGRNMSLLVRGKKQFGEG